MEGGSTRGREGGSKRGREGKMKKIKQIKTSVVRLKISYTQNSRLMK
jgi:hypothetical protein